MSALDGVCGPMAGARPKEDRTGVSPKLGVGRDPAVGARPRFYLGTLACSRASIAATRSSYEKTPSYRSPLMKNDGVPLTPLRTPPRKSAFILAENFLVANASRRPPSDRPRVLPRAKMSVTPS